MKRKTRSTLNSPRHEAFAQATARGECITTAYQEVGFAQHRSSASRLLAAASIKQRVEQTRAENDEMCQSQRHEALAYLT